LSDLPPDQLTHDQKRRIHYELEKALAQLIKAAPASDRARIAGEAMDTVFREIPWHPMLTLPEDEYRKRLARKIAAFSPWIPSGKDLIEIGCGKGEMTAAFAGRSKTCTGIDVSSEILKSAPRIPNVTYIVMDAVTLELPGDSFDIAVSSQLIEHLHPEDVAGHFAAVARVLRPGGCYVFNTPNRINGPWDVSRYFDDVATGFHLKEWTYAEIIAALRAAGFAKIRSQVFPGRLGLGPLFRMGVRSAAWKVLCEKLCAKVRHKTLRLKLSKALNVNDIFISAQVSRV